MILIMVDELLIFINAIHRNKTCEIRFIPELNFVPSQSLLIHKGFLYRDDANGKKTKVCELTNNKYMEAINEEFLYTAPCAVTFTVNSPNFELMDTCVTKDKHILEGGSINAQFIDIDAPKDIRKSTDKLKKWKMEQAENIKNFILHPSIVVETKNGYHVYWLINNGEVEKFRCIQMQLIIKFGGDRNCINESRLLRLPGFPHTKGEKKHFPIMVRVFDPERIYTQTELMTVLPQLDVETIIPISRKGDKELLIPT
jgi:phage pi2 protein 07